MIFDISHPHDLRAPLGKLSMTTEEIDAFLADPRADEDMKRLLLLDVQQQGYQAKEPAPPSDAKMERYLVLVSDSRTDLPTGWGERPPEIWGYEVDAVSPQAAVPLGLELWHADVGERLAVSIYAVPVSRLPRGARRG